MPAVVFYEKPGCLTNARQKALLEHHGFRLTVRNLLSEPWTESRLYEFLVKKPVAEWFNLAAPKIRTGEINAEALDVRSAMALLLGEPILIRRPLIETEFGKYAGFEDAELLTGLGIHADEINSGNQSCARPAESRGCPQPG